MFTGLVETIGHLRHKAGGPVVRALFDASLGKLDLGESIAVNGVCLTVDRIVATGFEADMSPETLTRTTLGALVAGARVHLERATPLGGRMGGHVVLGHVDGIGRVTDLSPRGDAMRLEVQVGGHLAPYLAEKGSVCIDGVSLTINRVEDRLAERSSSVLFEVMLVPHTLSRTLLGNLRAGQGVNIEVDVLARYVARQLALGVTKGRGESSGRADEQHHDESGDERLLEKLRAGGFVR
ncbi:MAG: riboflavin synthase [Polyangiaceae bacterium]|nr:riboflavin synthase [Polyangiaceae bacterium]